MHDGGRIDRAASLADAPFKSVAAGEGADHAREEHRAVRLRAELVGELAFFEVRNVSREGRGGIVGHGVFSPAQLCSLQASRQSTAPASMVRMQGGSATLLRNRRRRMRTAVLSLAATLLVGAHALAQERTRSVVKYDNVEIDLIAQGKGPLIVLLPSRGRDSEDYEDVAAGLAQEGFRVLR